MARMRSQGVEELAADLKKLDKDADAVQQEMLDAGAKSLVSDWKKGIESAGHVDTGAMKKSVRSSKTAKKRQREIYPRGKDEKGVRNAEKAFILHYGTSKIKGDRFIDAIEEAGEPAAVQSMEKVLERHLRKRGLI